VRPLIVGLSPKICIITCLPRQADRYYRVPFTQSVTYVEAAQAAGQDAELREVAGDHFSVADFGSPTWPTIVEVLEQLSDGT
jgi:hypothetical protein